MHRLLVMEGRGVFRARYKYFYDSAPGLQIKWFEQAPKIM